jgi:chemotaxis protein histidine kinase CheA
VEISDLHNQSSAVWGASNPAAQAAAQRAAQAKQQQAAQQRAAQQRAAQQRQQQAAHQRQQQAAHQRQEQAQQHAQQAAHQRQEEARQHAQQAAQQRQQQEQQHAQQAAQQRQQQAQEHAQQAAQHRQQEQAEQKQESFRQEHPARAEVLGRDANLNKQINQDKGDLSGHYGQLRSEDNAIRRQEQIDAARNGGHLTGQEYKQLNGEENGLSRQVSRDNYGAGDAQFQKTHPGRSEVLGRDANLNRVLNEDKGDLSGHYGQLKTEDNAIRRQEQIDAARNGGHLTGQEYKQLNGEENGLSRQIGRDNYGAGDAQFQKTHQGRSEVLGRDANLNNQINGDYGHLSGHYGQLKSEDNAIRHQEQVDAARNGGHLTGQEYRQLNREENGLARQISHDKRPINPPPLHGNPAPFQQAAPAPTLQGQVSSAQQAQAASAYQNMQNNLYPVPISQAPAGYQQAAGAQTSGYLNNTPASLGGQPVTINSGNTYVSNVPQSNYPSWWGGGGSGGGGGGGGGGGFWQPGPGWGWSNGFTIGAIVNAGLGWLRFGWPHYYGPPPTGFMYPPGFVPTPWVYNPMLNMWRQPGQMAWSPVPPPPEYTMPITVQVIEPIRILAPTPNGPMPETVNQLVMYNAHYFPSMGRWGYRNRNGYFVWLNNAPPQLS